jgi:phosphoglycolate phosphatase-like HAD superfamily hydrolase
MKATRTEKNFTMYSKNGFRWSDADAYLFDIDGTLLVTKDLVHYNAINDAMLEVYGVATTIDGIAYHGKTDLGILRAALHRAGVSSEAFEAKLPAALDAVCRKVSESAAKLNPKVCSAIPQILQTLKSSGKLLGVASGNLESVGWHKVQSAGLREFFSFGCFSDQRESRADIFAEGMQRVRQRIGDRATVCFFGDTPEDIKAAKSAGAHIVAVCTGVFPADELISYDPDLCISSCEELLGANVNTR